MVNPEKFTSSTQELLNHAATIASEHKNPTLQPLHLLLASLTDQFCQSFYQFFAINQRELMHLATTELAKLPTVSGGQLSLDKSLEEFLDSAWQEAQTLGDTYLSLEHILLALSATNRLPSSLQDYLRTHKFVRHTILEHMKTLRKGKTVQEKNAEKQYQILERYCQNLTDLARQGKLDPVIGRHEEIRRVIQILSRRTKNNPLLIGEPGVGKTAIVEGIAQRIINNDVPESLKGNTIYSLDLGLLIAGTKFQGEFEERLKGILKEIEAAQDQIILFIDEIHMLIGAGSTGSGGMDASNLLKPALARGTLHCIGATTLKEYKKYIEKDAALERRFQKVAVEEPSIEDALSILRGLKERYELHHGIRIKDQALVDAVQLAAKNIPDRFLPDKAIDLIDEAAAMVKMAIDSQPAEIDQLERKLNQLEIEKVALLKEKDEASKKRLTELEKELSELRQRHTQLLNQWKAEKAPLERINKIKEDIEQAQHRFQQAEREGDFAKASEIKYGKLIKLNEELAKEQEKLKQLPSTLIKEEVDEADIARVLSRWTGIPVEKLQTSESTKLLAMEDILKRHVIGQDDAIAEVAQAIRLHRTGLADPNKPIGTFLFLGPTGVGKTEVAKILADFLFDDEKKLIRIDMSEYMEKHAVARLIGSPPGYVGYEEGGQLTEAVRRQPYSVILIDEIEKAHPDVFNIFLQILDEGRLTDSQGRTVSFKNCIIIMTSNVGSDIILGADEITEKVKQSIEQILRKTFRPEFLNRIDAIVFFRRLTHEDMVKIAENQIKMLHNRLAEQNITLKVTAPVINKVADLGYEPEFGARPLKRAIQKHISVPISQYLLKNPDAGEIHITLADDTITIK
jgi:ATP-dependent Clp protease ATP-binding subunit ClpB